MKNNTALFCLIALTAFMATSCSTAYYNVMETFGVEKRDMLQNHVQAIRDIQEKVQNHFSSALDYYLAVVSIKGGELEKKYRKLNKEYDLSEKEVERLEDKVERFNKVSKDLMKEWKKELKQYSNKDLRDASARKRKETGAKLDKLLAGMNQSLAATKPVLTQLHDQVLFLKHNLNSQAISGLQQESERIKSDVQKVITSMQASIQESQAFIDEMGLLDK